MFDYTRQSSLIPFTNKFYDEFIFPFFEECSEITFDNDEKKNYLIHCNSLFEKFAKTANEEYLKKVSDSRWEDKIQCMVNNRLHFLPIVKKPNIIHQLIKRQCNNNCNLIMQTAFHVPNYMLYKQMKDSYFKYCCETNPVFSHSIKSIAKFYESVHINIEKFYIKYIKQIKCKLLNVIRYESGTREVVNSLHWIIKKVFVGTDLEHCIRNFLEHWRHDYIKDENILWIIHETAYRSVLSFGPRENAFINTIQYEGAYPQWINDIEDFNLRETCCFGHIMTVDMQLFIEMIQIERENLALFLIEFLLYYLNIFSAKGFDIIDETEPTSELIQVLQQLHLK